MRHYGRISEWKDDPGFGFIEPDDGGRRIFLHASNFHDAGHPPVVGQAVSYELGSDAQGRPKAVHVASRSAGIPSVPGNRAARSRATGSQRQGHSATRASRWSASTFVPLAALVVMAAWAMMDGLVGGKVASAPSDVDRPVPLPATGPAAATYSCDGRTSCTQMTSCAEATYFIQHCPNTKMDGDGDGIPCENQWCD